MSADIALTEIQVSSSFCFSVFSTCFCGKTGYDLIDLSRWVNMRGSQVCCRERPVAKILVSLFSE